MREVGEATELITSGPAEALSGLLGVPMPDLDAGEGLPLLWHWIYLLERPPQAALGADGCPVLDTIPLPPGPGLRRMFAGGRISRHGPLRTGMEATRRTWQTNSAQKLGRSGPLEFFTVRSEISQGGQIVLTEERDLVYCGPAKAAGSPARAAPDRQRSGAETHEWLVSMDPVLLFRFSALTYNAHRIHYDREYARAVEGYSGLVVHGTLQALLMAEQARRVTVTPSMRCDYSYRLVAPLFDGQDLIVSASADAEAVRMTTRDSTDRETAVGVIHCGSPR
jgi:3-methylfumaryl-CoA hydratase